MKKAQAVSLFLIVGVVLLITFGIFFYLRISINKQSSDISTNFETQKVQLASQIQDCVRIETKEAVNLYGLNYWSSKEEIEYYIESNLDDCIDFEAFENAGLRIEKEEIKANTTKSGNYLEVKVKYLITLSNKISSAEIENFIYNMEISKEKYIANEEGYTKTDNIIELKDAGIKLEITEGTLIEGSENKISIEARGKNIVEAYFDRGVSNILYELGPDGASFSKPVKLSIEYDEDILPEGFTEDDLSIVYFDEDSGTWKELETTLDKKNNIASANIEHFSVYSLAWIVEYQERFFTGVYAENKAQFCEDIKRDLENNLDDIIKYAVTEIPPRSKDYKYMTNTNIFRESVANAVSEGTRGIVKFFKGDINDVIDLSSASTRRLFFNSEGDYKDILNWCYNHPTYKEEYGTEEFFIDFCKEKLEYCIKGETFYAPHCKGITNIDHLYHECRKKASSLERESPDEMTIEVDGELVAFGPDECQLGGNGMCLSETRCYDNIHLCYFFTSENPAEQECPPNRNIDFYWCPQGHNVRCCKRPEFVEEEIIPEVEVPENRKLWKTKVRITKYYTPQEADFTTWSSTGRSVTSIEACNIPLASRGFYEDIMCQGSGIGLNGELYTYNSISYVKGYSTPVGNRDDIRTASGKAPVEGRTIAGPANIPFGTRFYIDFGDNPWTGEYVVEDRGGAVQNHFDLYVGVGKTSLNSANILDYAIVYIMI